MPPRGCAWPAAASASMGNWSNASPTPADRLTKPIRITAARTAANTVRGPRPTAASERVSAAARGAPAQSRRGAVAQAQAERRKPSPASRCRRSTTAVLARPGVSHGPTPPRRAPRAHAAGSAPVPTATATGETRTRGATPTVVRPASTPPRTAGHAERSAPPRRLPSSSMSIPRSPSPVRRGLADMPANSAGATAPAGTAS